MKPARGKTDWPVICAFICIGCMAFLSGRSFSDPAAEIVTGLLVIAFVWLGVGLLTEIFRKRP